MRGLAIYDDDIMNILRDCCECTITRASHVETINNLPEETKKRIDCKDASVWWVDFSPIKDDTLLGPFESRQRALEAEKEYLENQLKNSSGIVIAEAAFS